MRSAVGLTLWGCLLLGVVGAVGAFPGFRGPATAVAVNVAPTLWLSPALRAVQPSLRSAWFRVRPWEPAMYRSLRVPQCGRALQRCGWESLRRRRRSSGGTRAMLVALERDTRMAEVAHAAAAGVVLVAVVVATGHRAWDAVGWLSGTAVVLHGYPVMLQRLVRSRVPATLVHAPPAPASRAPRSVV